LRGNADRTTHAFADHQSAGVHMDRRVFMKSGAMAMVTMGLNPSFLRRTTYGMDLPKAAKGKVLICIFQRGAADALNVVVPHGDASYYTLRPNIAIPRPSGSGWEVWTAPGVALTQATVRSRSAGTDCGGRQSEQHALAL
jgi:uncharacterized protein (DUF1501 family)